MALTIAPDTPRGLIYPIYMPMAITICVGKWVPNVCACGGVWILSIRSNRIDLYGNAEWTHCVWIQWQWRVTERGEDECRWRVGTATTRATPAPTIWARTNVFLGYRYICSCHWIIMYNRILSLWAGYLTDSWSRRRRVGWSPHNGNQNRFRGLGLPSISSDYDAKPILSRHGAPQEATTTGDWIIKRPLLKALLPSLASRD